MGVAENLPRALSRGAQVVAEADFQSLWRVWLQKNVAGKFRRIRWTFSLVAHLVTRLQPGAPYFLQIVSKSMDYKDIVVVVKSPRPYSFLMSQITFI